MYISVPVVLLTHDGIVTVIKASLSDQFNYGKVSPIDVGVMNRRFFLNVASMGLVLKLPQPHRFN